MLTIAFIVGIILFLFIRFIILQTSKKAKLVSEVDKIKFKEDDLKELTPETKELVEKLKDIKSLRMTYKGGFRFIRLPDGQEFAPSHYDLDMFENQSTINSEPTRAEWAYLREIIARINSKLK
jgi:hypothetical protein